MDSQEYNNSSHRLAEGLKLHGQAALLLVESLMHELVTKGVISRQSFIDIVDGAAEIEVELAEDGSRSTAKPSGSLLNPLATAFRRELDNVRVVPG